MTPRHGPCCNGGPMNRASWIVLLLAAGCATTVSIDGGVDDAGQVAPVAPMAVRFACPAGWRTSDAAGASVCEPFTGDVAPTCAEDELALPGEATDCQPVWPCSAGPWPDDAPADGVYFLPGATGGDGSRDAPFGNLTSATAAARRSSVALVIGEGELFAALDASGIPLVMGLCPERSRIRYDAGPALHVRSGTTEVVGLSLVSEGYTALEVRGGASVRARGVIAWGFVNGASVREGATLDADHVLLRGPDVDRVSDFVSALLVHAGTSATLRHFRLMGGGGGVASPNEPGVPAQLLLEDGAILDVPYGTLGLSNATLRRVAIARAAIGMIVAPGASATLEDVVVEDIGESLYGGGSVGLLTGSGSITLRQTLIRRVRGYAIASLSAPAAPAALDAEDLVVQGIRPSLAADRADRIALLVAGPDGTAQLDRVHIADIDGNAIQVEDSALTASDVRVVDAHAVGDSWGHAFQAYGAAVVTLDRADVAPDYFGLFVVDGAVVTATDFRQTHGLGVHVQCDPACPEDAASPRLSLGRASLEGVRGAGVRVWNATVRLTDVSIRDVVPTVSPVALDDVPGTGISADGGLVVGERVRIESIAGIGLLAYRSRFELDDVRIDDVRTVDCECGPNAYGDGVLWTLGATVAIRGLDVSRAARGGLVAAFEYGPPTLSGVVHDCGYGLISDARTPTALVLPDVLLENNGAPILSTDVTLGEVSSPFRRRAPRADPSGIGF